MFKLSRTGNNVPAEVQRWQYFLRTQGIIQVGGIDADFGPKTELGTKIFQMSEGLTAHGRAGKKTLTAASSKGYRILDADYYKKRSSLDWPNRPTGLSSPKNSFRNSKFSCFEFTQRKLSQRPSPESIVIKGSCNGTTSDWVNANIVDVPSTAFEYVTGYGGAIRCHLKAWPYFEALFESWREESLLHLVINYAGCFVPRYIRGGAPAGSGGHGKRQSVNVSKLSNHSFGSAFDINTTWNWLGDTPARCGQKGSVRELVEAGNALGLYWGGHYKSRKDGMHFEIAR